MASTKMAAGTSLSSPHPTIANLKVILTDTSANTGLILFSTISTTPDATASTYQKGSIALATSSGTGISGVVTNVGTALLPVWSKIGAAGVTEVNGPSVPLFLLDNGGNSNIVVTAYAVGTTFVPLVTGLLVGVRLKGTLTKQTANSVNFNGTVKSLFSHTNPAKQISTTYVAGAVIQMVYLPGVAGGVWEDLAS